MTSANTFVLTKNLEDLTAEERQQHLMNVSESLGLDPARGLLKYARMPKNDNTGEDRLVLYATKGATDALRDIHEVDVIDLTDKVINGAIVYTAKGKNKKGRVDIAVGAAAIEGKHGPQLANAFAVAQTKATRRLTLQFTGSGLLDESEVMDNTTSIANAPVPLSEIGDPLPVSSAAGVDITLPAGIKTPPAPTGPARIPNPAAGMKPITIMAGPDGVKPAEKAPEKIAPAPAPQPPAEDLAIPSGAVHVEESKPTRKKRRTKAEMEAARAAEVTQVPEQTSPAAPEATETESPAPSVEVGELATAAPDPPATAPEKPARASKKVTVPLIGDMPTQDQAQVYVSKLLNYSDKILTDAGMLPSLGLGPRGKLREFMKMLNAGNDLTALTNPQWENSFRFLDETIASKGALGLVQLIDFNIVEKQKEAANGTSA